MTQNLVHAGAQPSLAHMHKVGVVSDKCRVHVEFLSQCLSLSPFHLFASLMVPLAKGLGRVCFSAVPETLLNFAVPQFPHLGNGVFSGPRVHEGRRTEDPGNVMTRTAMW